MIPDITRRVPSSLQQNYRIVVPAEGGSQVFAPVQSMALPVPFTQINAIASTFSNLQIGMSYLVTIGMQFSVDTIITGFRLQARIDGVNILSHYNAWSHLINNGGDVETLFATALFTPTAANHVIAPYVARFGGAATLYVAEWDCAFYGPLAV